MNFGGQVYKITDDYMKSNYVKILEYEWIENLIYFLCVYPIVAMINYGISRNENMLYVNLLTIIPIFVMTYLRIKIKKKSDFILSLIGTMVISSIVIGFFLKQYVFLVLLIFWAINSINKYSSKQGVEFNKFKLIMVQALLIPQIIVIAGANFEKLQILTVITSIVIMGISIGYICKVRYTRLTMDDAKNKSFNKKDNNLFIAGIILLIAVLIFLLYKFGIFDVTYNLTRKLANSLIDTANFITSIASYGHFPLILKSKGNMHEFNNSLMEAPSIFDQIISILFIVLNVVLIIALIAGTIYISYLLINRILIYIKKLGNKDKITFVFNSDKESEIKKNADKKRYNISKSIFLKDREKIRKLYKDNILKYKKNNINVNNFYSTNEIQKEILSKVSDNIEDITRMYEKARYSNEEIIKEDVEILKNKMKSS